MSFSESAAYMKAPVSPQQIAGTGATAAGNTTALTSGRMATMLVGAAAVRMLFASSNTGNVAATDPILPAYGRFDWFVEPSTAFVRLEAADGAAAFEASVWTSSQ